MLCCLSSFSIACPTCCSQVGKLLAELVREPAGPGAGGGGSGRREAAGGGDSAAVGVSAGVMLKILRMILIIIIILKTLKLWAIIVCSCYLNACLLWPHS